MTAEKRLTCSREIVDAALLSSLVNRLDGDFPDDCLQAVADRWSRSSTRPTPPTESQELHEAAVLLADQARATLAVVDDEAARDTSTGRSDREGRARDGDHTLPATRRRSARARSPRTRAVARGAGVGQNAPDVMNIARLECMAALQLAEVSRRPRRHGTR